MPPPRLWGRLALTAIGVVFGFPLFSALALTQVPAAHGAVIVGLLPAATAVMAALRAGERPSLGFWLAALLGLVAVLTFAVVQGAGRPQLADGLILLAVALGALGYAEGGSLSRELGGWQVISWVLVLSAPLLLPVVAWRVLQTGLSASLPAWLGFAYVSLVSMYLGFFAWYRGLAAGGVARIGQIQLAQPVLTLLWSVLLLGERVTWDMIFAAAAVLACVALSQRTRVVHQTRG
jgi:drug/metabolite transporter (DMT)-like permease